jgi:hypothetical protein
MRWTILQHNPFSGEWTPYVNARGAMVTADCEAMAIIKARALASVYRGVLYRAAPVVEAVSQ